MESNNHALLSQGSETSKSTMSNNDFESESSDASNPFANESKAIPYPKNSRIDESKLSPLDAKKLEKRRAYNRECASRARKRTKGLLSQLQSEVAALQKDKEVLAKANSSLTVQVGLFKRECDRLIVRHQMEKQQLLRSCLSRTSPPTNAGLVNAPFLMSLHKNARQQTGFLPSFPQG